MSTDSENGRFLRLRTNSHFNVELQHCSAISACKIAVSGDRCGSVFPEHPVHLMSMFPPRLRCRAFLWRYPAQPTRISPCTSPLPSCRTCKERSTSFPCGLHQLTAEADKWGVGPKRRFSGQAHYFGHGRRRQRGWTEGHVPPVHNSGRNVHLEIATDKSSENLPTFLFFLQYFQNRVTEIRGKSEFGGLVGLLHLNPLP